MGVDPISNALLQNHRDWKHPPLAKNLLGMKPFVQSVTLNVYAHLMKPTNQEAASKLENKILYQN
jgi:hypothetical protein